MIPGNDDKFGPMFDQVADTTGITVLHTPMHAPRANAAFVIVYETALAAIALYLILSAA